MFARDSITKNVVFCRSNPIAPDPRVEKAARALYAGGWQVTLIGWDRMGDLPVLECREYAKIIRLRIKASYARGLSNLPMLMIWELFLLRWLFLHRQEYQVIHSCDFDTILPALFIKWLFGKKVVYDIFDFYADHLRKTPEWIKALIRTVDKWAIHHADAVILADDARKSQIKGAQPKKIVVVYNTPEDIGTLSSKEPLNVQARMKIAYVGLLQLERGLLDLLTVLKSHQDWHLFLAGFGGDQQEILQIAKHLTNVHWQGRIFYEKAISLTAQCDVMIALYDPRIPNHRFASPNKLFEAMMLGKPIVVAENTNIDTLVKKFHCGLVIPYGDVKQLENALCELAENVALRQELGNNSRRAYETHFSWNEMRERLHSLYSTI